MEVEESCEVRLRTLRIGFVGAAAGVGTDGVGAAPNAVGVAAALAAIYSSRLFLISAR